MRRKKQEISLDECKQVLRENPTGVLALYDKNNYPYAVPLNYWYDITTNKIYFHCAKEGHKIEAIDNCDRASFCVVDKDEILPEKYTTKYCSVIAFGKVQIVEDKQLRLYAIENLSVKYNPNDKIGLMQEIEKFISATCILELSVENMTGKIGLELMKEKNKEQ